MITLPKPCALAAAISLAACGATNDTSLPHEALHQPPGPPAQYVLVPYAATLYTSPDPDAPHTPIAERLPMHVVPMRAVAQRNGWIDVETLGDKDEAQCYGDVPGLRGLALRFEVRAEEIAPVTTREARVEFGDETWVALTAGVHLSLLPALSRPGRPIYTVRVDDLTFNTTVPADAIGGSYVPSPHFETSRAPFMLSPTATPLFGGRARVAQDAPVGFRYVYARDDRPAAALVELRSHCAAMRVRVAPQAVVPAMGGLGLAGAMSEGGASTVRAGAELFWSTGEPAGHAVRDVAFAREVEGAHGQRCFRRGFILGGENAPGIVVCANAADVHGGEPPAPVTPPVAAPDAGVPGASTESAPDAAPSVADGGAG